MRKLKPPILKSRRPRVSGRESDRSAADRRMLAVAEKLIRSHSTLFRLLAAE